jgi:hypothetical protein
MKQVIIGAVMGLLISTSLYVWNSNTFTKEQKIFLIICIIFPPAQWIGILIILIYNNYKSENTPEKLIEKKVIEKKINLNSSIENLLELKEKGILTIDEFNEKIEKIETQKIEEEIKNSSEFKQLKSLFDNNILTLAEFENKIKLLENKYLKKNGNSEVVVSIKPKYDFRILSERKKFDTAWGSYTEYELEYSDGHKGEVYKGGDSGKYFYVKSTMGAIYPIYGNNFEEVVYKEYQQL